MVRRFFLSCAVVACGGGNIGPQAPNAPLPAHVVIRIDAVRVSAKRVNGTTWDSPEPEHRDSGLCGLIGALATAAAGYAGLGPATPIAGSAATFLCRSSEGQPQQRENDPTNPDLQLLVGASNDAPYESEIARDALQTTFAYAVVVPTDVIPPDGLRLEVVDNDGATRESLGLVRFTASDIAQVLRSSTRLAARSQDNVERIEVVIASYVPPTTMTMAMQANEGTKDVGAEAVRAGEVVRVTGSGNYQIGSWNDDVITPVGYPNGGPIGYNFAYEPLRSASHGCGFALLGRKTREATLVTPCGALLANVTGPIIVGINDKDPNNNKGSVSFLVERRPPTPDEWRRHRILGNGCQQ